MPALLGALLKRLILAQLAVTGALAVLITAAALVEGHAPDPARLRSLALGGGAALGAVWILAAFRREGGDIALAALGIPPACVVLLCLGAGLPTLALAGGAPAPAPGWITPQHLDLPRGQITWQDGIAHRTDTEPATFAGLPAPTHTPAPRGDWTFPIRCLALAAALTWLARRTAAPDVPATLSAGALATLLGLLPALVT